MYIVSHKKCTFLNVSAKFVIKKMQFSYNAGKPLTNFTACIFSKNAAHPQVFSRQFLRPSNF